MNKSAAKEPSMDEILSSIRQIIADDDAGDAPVEAAAETEPQTDVADTAFDIPDTLDADTVDEIADIMGDQDDALELSADQIVEVEEDVAAFAEPDEDLTTDPMMEADPITDAEPAADMDEPLAGVEEPDEEASEEFAIPELVVPDDISFDEEMAETDPAPEPPVQALGETEALPDPDLSADIAERLLEPATDAAVKGAFAKLGNMALGAHNLTIENMIREMLRPMLKEWLDENLPGVVEKMVEKEIERLARGG